MKLSKERLSVEKSPAFWVITIFMGLYFMIAPFYRGLFVGNTATFEGPIYSAVIITTIVMMIIALQWLRNWELTTHRDILVLLVWFIPLSFWFSSFGAASKHLAINEVYIKVMWAAFFVIGAYFTGNKFRLSLFQYLLVGSGYFIVAYGFLNWFGNIEYPDAILSGRRLSNVFQYPNAYAAYLIGLFVAALILVRNETKSYLRLLHGSMMVPILLSFLLTLSRGGASIFPVILILYLVFMSLRSQIITLLNILVAGIAALLLFNPLMNIRAILAEDFSLQRSLFGWFLLILASILSGAAMFWIEKWSSRHSPAVDKHSFGWKNIIIPFVLVILILSSVALLTNSTTIANLLPDEISKRIAGLSTDSNSVFQRNTFVKDALRIVKDYPLLGTGGGGWQSLYNSYKSYPYTSTQAHNFYIQYLVEAGILGSIIFLSIMAYILYVFLRSVFADRSISHRKLVFFFFAVSILAHSILDFDMSYVYLSSIVMFALGVLVSDEGNPINVLTKLKNTKKNTTRFVRFGCSILLIAVSTILLIQTVSAKKANSSYSKAVEIAVNTGNYSEFSVHLDDAVKRQPNHPEYSLFKADVLMQLYQQMNNELILEQAEQLLDHIGKREPYNSSVLEGQYNLHLLRDNTARALEITEFALSVDPWAIHLYERAAILNVVMGVQAIEMGLESNQYFHKVIDIRDYIEEKNKSFETLPKSVARAGRDFRVNRIIVSQTGKALYFLGDYEASAAYLKQYLTRKLDTVENREIVRFYLASLMKQGKNNKTWTDRLYEADQNEKDYLNSLLQF